MSGFVYFIQQGTDGPIKIGWSEDPGRRLQELQTAASAPLILRVAIPAESRSHETRFHVRFARSRLFGEWFSPDESILATIESALAPDTGPQEPSKPDEDLARRIPLLKSDEWAFLGECLHAGASGAVLQQEDSDHGSSFLEFLTRSGGGFETVSALDLGGDPGRDKEVALLAAEAIGSHRLCIDHVGAELHGAPKDSAFAAMRRGPIERVVYARAKLGLQTIVASHMGPADLLANYGLHVVRRVMPLNGFCMFVDRKGRGELKTFRIYNEATAPGEHYLDLLAMEWQQPVRKGRSA